MRCLVTGCAGFIGSHLTDRLLSEGHVVVGYDNLSTGQEVFLTQALQSPNFSFIRGDILDLDTLTEAARSTSIVFHLAANADVRFGLQHPSKDLQRNTIGTFNVLEAMRANGVKRIAFSSTGSVYGEAEVFPTPENSPFPVQTSLYAASKLSGESLIEAYCQGYGFQGFIFRFVSILGERYTHGHVFDFYKKLRMNPTQIEVLGNGKQRKSYLYVQDCIDAILLVVEKASEAVNIYNLGTDEYCQVDDSLDWITAHLGLKPERLYTGGERGWIGDNPFIFLDCSKVRALGWSPRHTIRESVLLTLDYLRANLFLLESRA
jgi:UDP-glucose 4-epimerase